MTDILLADAYRVVVLKVLKETDKKILFNPANPWVTLFGGHKVFFDKFLDVVDVLEHIFGASRLFLHVIDCLNPFGQLGSFVYLVPVNIRVRS